MSNRSHLVPVPVTDKNGVTTTRWKRPVSPSASLAPLPAPSVWSDRADAARELDEALERDGYVMSTIILDVMNTRGHNREWREKIKNGVTQETLRIFDEKFKGNYGTIVPFVKRCIEEQSPASLNNAALFIDLLDECHEKYGNDHTQKDDGNDMFAKFIFGLQWHHRANNKDFSSFEAGREQGDALLRANRTLGMPYRQYYSNGQESMYYLPSRGLTELISKRPQDVDRIVSILRERRLPASTEEEISTIEALLDESASPSLSSGAL